MPPHASYRYDDNLIYDIGVNKGEDTEFYLNKGFRVVGIEAAGGVSEQKEVIGIQLHCLSELR